MIKTENIKNKLHRLGYKYKEDYYSEKEHVLKIYLPILCYLKIRFTEHKISITARTYIGSWFHTIEFNFILYGLATALLLAFEIIAVQSIFTALLGLFILYFLLCIIKLEFLRLMVIKWTEQELNSK